MLITEIGDLVKSRVKKWLEERKLHDVDVVIEIPQKMEYGDLSVPVALRLAKILKKDPAEIAKEIIGSLVNIPCIERIEVTKSGYINVHLDKESFYNSFIRLVLEKGIDYLREGVKKSGKIRIEYTSVNPNKAVHIGHARNVCLGNALHNTLSYLGYDVELLNYIDDTGMQMADLLIGFLYLGFDPEYRGGRFDQYCGDVVYVTSHSKIEESEELKRKRREIMKLIEEGDNAVAEFNRFVAEKVLTDQLKTCKRLGAEYDYLIWESDILRSGLHLVGLELIKKSNIVKYWTEGEYAGCWIAKVSEEKEVNPEIDEVLIRSDGTFTYVGKDVIFALWKMGLLKHPLRFKEFPLKFNGKQLYTTSYEGEPITLEECEKSINVIGVEQSKQQNVIKRIIESIYGTKYSERYVHYYYNLVHLSKRTVEKYFGKEVESKAVKMSGRLGLYVNVDVVLDMMKERTFSLMLKNNPSINKEVAADLSERIAVAALKYMLLSTDRDKAVIFDIDDALDVMKESGVYILYSYARANSILKKAAESNIRYEDGRLTISSLNEYDVKLMRYLTLSPIVLRDFTKSLEVKVFPQYMYKLSQIFNEFYEHNPVLKSDREEVLVNRLLIVKTFTTVMELFAHLSGIPLVDIM